MTHKKGNIPLLPLSPKVLAAEALYRGRGITEDGYLYNGSTHVKYLGIAVEDAALGAIVECETKGVAIAESGANIAQGDILGFDTVGRVVPYASAADNAKIGTAREAISTGAGYEVEVLLGRLEVPTTPGVAGIGDKKVATVVIDATSGLAIGAHAGAIIPDNSLVTRAYYNVSTTCTSATDAGTLALHVEGANDIVTATAISAGGNIWDAGAAFDTIVDGTIATMIKTTAARAITATIAVEDFTDGYITLFVEYVVCTA